MFRMEKVPDLLQLQLGLPCADAGSSAALADSGVAAYSNLGNPFEALSASHQDRCIRRLVPLPHMPPLLVVAFGLSAPFSHDPPFF